MHHPTLTSVWALVVATAALVAHARNEPCRTSTECSQTCIRGEYHVVTSPVRRGISAAAAPLITNGTALPPAPAPMTASRLGCVEGLETIFVVKTCGESGDEPLDGQLSMAQTPPQLTAEGRACEVAGGRACVVGCLLGGAQVLRFDAVCGRFGFQSVEFAIGNAFGAVSLVCYGA